MTASSEHVFCVLTPRGRAAVASICVRGLNAIAIVEQHFAGAAGIPISSYPVNAVVYGNWLAGGRKGEDLVVCPISDREIEVYCHGGEAATNVIRRSLVSSGVTEIQFAECTQSGASSSLESDLIMALANAPTRKTAKLLLAQQEIQQQLITALKHCVANKDREKATDLIAQTLAWKQFGTHLVTPWTVVVCGKPNVGKSSLINAMVGFERAIVHATAGTTRDILTQTTAIKGWPIELTDTAGLRDDAQEIEQAGIQLAEKRITQADLVIAVFDASQSWTNEDHLVLQRTGPRIIVFNKSDIQAKHTQFPGLLVSAKTGHGVEDLIDTLAQTLVPHLPNSRQAIPVSNRQANCLEQAGLLIQNERWSDVAGLLGLTLIRQFF